MTDFAQRIADDMPRTRADLEELVRIPGCAFPGFPDAEIERACEAVMRILSDAGCTVQRLEIPGAKPTVVAEAPGPEGSPTVLLYAHYDVQPGGDETLWDSPPFEPTERDGRLYGRGAADDKSGVVIHAAVLRTFEGRPPCTVRVIVEGEEEWGGPFAEYPRSNPELFAADAIVVADVGNARIGEPTFTTALRGMAMVSVECRTLAGAVHSGMFGGPAPDALMSLIMLLSTLRDPQTGETTIDGVEGFDWDGAQFDEAEFRELAGVLEDQPLVGQGTVASRLFSKPVASVVGVDAPATEGAINAVIPWAKARVSLRVPPGHDAEAACGALIRHLETHAPWGVQVSVTREATGQGVRVPTDGPAYAAARRAMEQAYGKQPQEIGAGGSIPLIDSLMAAVPQAEVLLFGAQDPMARIHAPNESVDLAELQRAVLAEALFLAEFSGARPA